MEEERSENPNDITPESPEGPMSDSDDESELPPYLPAVMGCRSVSEFLCLNKY